jgi:integrase
MRRRGHGEGSIFKRKDGRWAASITLENRKRKTFYGKTKKEVQEQLKRAQLERQQGTFIAGGQQTVAHYLNDWLKVHKQTIRPRSHERYEAIIRLHLVPRLGHIHLHKLTAQHLDTLYIEKVDEGLSPTTVTAVHTMLHTALEKAVRLGLVSRNVCDLVSPPRKIRKEIKPLSTEQVLQFLEAAKGHPQETLFILALTTGMRRGELLGLKWQDIDFAKSILQVRRALTRMPTGLGYKETEPKTKLSRRSIVIISFALEALKKHKAKQLEMRLKAGEAWQDHDYVFCTSIGTHLSPSHGVLVQLKNVLKKAGLPDIRFHDLRHSMATLLLSKGVHPKVVQEILGHSEISMTMDTYSHVLPTMQKNAMDELNDIFGG